MSFEAILALVQGWSNQRWKDALLLTFSELSFESGLGTHLRDRHGHPFLWDLKLVWPSFKVGQTNVEKMHIYWFSRNWVLKVDLCTHLRDKHGHLLLWDLEQVWASFKVGQIRLKICTFVDFLKSSFESGFRYLFER